MNDENERSVASTGSTAHDEAHDRNMTRRMILGSLAECGYRDANAEAVEFVRASAKPVLIAIRMDRYVSEDALRMIQDYLQPIQERVGVPFVLVPKGMTLEAAFDPRDGVR